jgi:hypothetical protein
MLGAIGQARFEQTEEEEEEERQNKYYGFAASAATAEELKLAKTEIQPDGTKAVVCSKRVWRPQVKYEYQEIPKELDPCDDLDWLFEKHGKCMAKKKQ